MKIQSVRTPRRAAARGREYRWSGGKSVSVFDSTIVGVETDDGFTDYSDVCPLGPS